MRNPRLHPAVSGRSSVRPPQAVDIPHLLRSSGTLAERLAAQDRRRRGELAPDEASRAVGAVRLAAWRDRLTVEGRDYLLPRLRASGVRLSEALAACTPHSGFACSETPWLEPFLDGLAAADGHEPPTSDDLSDVPFGELVAAFADDGVRRVRRQDLWHRLAPRAKREARRDLARRVSNVLQWCLYADFHRFRDATHAANDDDAYRRFVFQMREPGRYNAFFNTYAGLARPLGSVLLNWTAHLEELLTRLEADRRLLGEALGYEPVLVSDIDMSISDPHNHGRGGAVLTFGSGHRLVYKPADNSLARLWQEGRQLLDCDRPSHYVLTRPGHSWHSFVPSVAMPDGNAEYQASLGKQMALATALGATDLHYENFVWDGQACHLVDFETVISPSPRLLRTGGDGAYRAALSRVLSSGLSTGALPGWAEGPGGELWNADALGWRQQQRPNFPRLQAINTGDMFIGSAAAATGAHADLADNVRAAPAALVQGLKAGWHQLEQHEKALQDLVDGLTDEAVRVVLRDTIFYVELTKQGYTPANCYDVLDRSLLFERLYRPFLDAPTKARWRLCEAEHEAMIRGDVPAFVTPADDVRLREVGATRASAVALPGTSPRKSARTNVRAIAGAADAQGGIAHSSFAVADWPKITTHPVKVPMPRGRPSRERLDVANTIVRHVASAAITAKDGSIALLGPFMHQSGRAQAMGVPPSTDTYMGITGLGLAAAAVNAVSPQAHARSLAVRVADALAAAAGELVSVDMANRCGAFTGPAGVCFALAKMADLLQEPSYKDQAVVTYLQVVRRDAGPEPELDVISGVAGALLVGAYLRGPVGRPDLDAHLLGLVRELVSYSVRTAPDRAHWTTGGVPGGVSGFAHGVAGIAASLAVAHRLGVKENADLIRSALLYEKSAYVASAGGWPAAGWSAKPGQIAQNVWCYGAGGVLVAASVAAQAGVVDEELLELAGGAATDARPEASGLCHGAGGMALLELHAGRLLDDPGLRASGLSRLERLASDVSCGRPLQLEPTPVIEHAHGLMTGATGVALALCAPELGPTAEALLAIA